MARRTRSRSGLPFAVAFGLAALPVGCFATIDRAKIGEADDASSPPTSEDGDLTDAAAEDASVDGARDGGPEASTFCSGTHAFCADFDTPGAAPADFGFEPHPVGERGTGTVTIESGGESLPNCARTRSPNDPTNDPGGTAGLRRSLDPTKNLLLGFDIQVQQPAWAGYDDTPDVKLAAVTTANDTISLSLHLVNPAKVDAAADRLFITLADPQSQVIFGFAPLPYATWVHVAIEISRSGVEVKVAGKVELTRGPIGFDKPGRDYNAFVLGAIRDFKPAPALDVRIDNVVLDYF